MSKSFKENLRQRLFGGASATETAAADLSLALKSHDGFLQRAGNIFNARVELQYAYARDLRHMDEKVGGSFMMALTTAGTMFGVALVSAVTAVFSTAAAPLLAVGAVAAGIGLVTGKLGLRGAHAYASIQDDLDQRFAKAEASAEIEILSMRRGLVSGTQGICQQFNELHALYEARRLTDTPALPARQEQVAGNDDTLAAAKRAMTSPDVVRCMVNGRR